MRILIFSDRWSTSRKIRHSLRWPEMGGGWKRPELQNRENPTCSCQLLSKNRTNDEFSEPLCKNYVENLENGNYSRSIDNGRDLIFDFAAGRHNRALNGAALPRARPDLPGPLQRRLSSGEYRAARCSVRHESRTNQEHRKVKRQKRTNLINSLFTKLPNKSVHRKRSPENWRNCRAYLRLDALVLLSTSGKIGFPRLEALGRTDHVKSVWRKKHEPLETGKWRGKSALRSNFTPSQNWKLINTTPIEKTRTIRFFFRDIWWWSWSVWTWDDFVELVKKGGELGLRKEKEARNYHFVICYPHSLQILKEFVPHIYMCLSKIIIDFFAGSRWQRRCACWYRHWSGSSRCTRRATSRVTSRRPTSPSDSTTRPPSSTCSTTDLHANMCGSRDKPTSGRY